MEDKKLAKLKRELKLKEFQFNSLYEFSSTIYSSFQIDNIIRIFFSTIMGQLGVSRIFFHDSNNKVMKKKGFRLAGDDLKKFNRLIRQIGSDWFYIRSEDLTSGLSELKDLLLARKIHYLINISDNKKNTIVMGLGYRFNKLELTLENIEMSFFVSRFALIAIENTYLINRIIETKRIEHEMKIAKDIQMSLLPQNLPKMENFDMTVIYKPINEVGGDYYDILNDRNGMLPILIADVEGKGLPAALLAASSQAIFHSLNELYFFEPAKFMAKANSLIHGLTRGSKFITIFWMLINNKEKTMTYVNAGHVAPFLLRKDKIIHLSHGGFLTGFVDTAVYEEESISLKKGDVVVAYTDGVPEVENPEGKEFGEKALYRFFQKNTELSAQQMGEKLFKKIKSFSKNRKFRDDFTLIILKVL